MNHVLPRFSNKVIKKAPILGGLWLVSNVSRDFQRSFFLLRALRVQIREPTKGRGGRRRGLKSKAKVSEEGRRNSIFVGETHWCYNDGNEPL